MRSCRLLLSFMVCLVTGLAVPAAAGAAPFGTQPVHAGPVTFYLYRNYDYKNCQAKGPATMVFATTNGGITYNVDLSNWKGYHFVRSRWYSPAGALYQSNSGFGDKDLGSTTACGQFDIRGTDAAHMPGRWTFKLFIDGRVAEVAYFFIGGSK
jgi:hypothetical protein